LPQLHFPIILGFKQALYAVQYDIMFDCLFC